MGAPAADTKVSFFITAGPNMGTSTGQAPPTTDANGKVSWSYPTRNGFGTDTIRADGLFGSIYFASLATVTWMPPTCTVAPTAAFTGNSATVIATVRDGSGKPVNNTTVGFVVLSGPNQGK